MTDYQREAALMLEAIPNADKLTDADTDALALALQRQTVGWLPRRIWIVSSHALGFLGAFDDETEADLFAAGFDNAHASPEVLRGTKSALDDLNINDPDPPA